MRRDEMGSSLGSLRSDDKVVVVIVVHGGFGWFNSILL